MGKMEMVTDKVSGLRQKLSSAVNTTGSTYERIKSIMGIVVMIFYRLRKVFLAIPVVYYALKLAQYNMEHLPESVGINLQASGVFADTISRGTAVMGPLGLTGCCLILMLMSRKSLVPWAICMFTLILPILLLISNIYPV